MFGMEYMSIKLKMMKINILLLFVIGVVTVSCNLNNHENKVPREKFEPEDGKVLLFAGQDLGAIGGLEDYSDGYFDHFEIPAGFTMYTNLRPGDSSFGHVYKGLDGVITTDNWGAGDCNIQMQLDDPDFKDCVLHLSLQYNGHDSAVAFGNHDSLIIKLGNWISGLKNRPVLFRIGYEFDGEWNNYNKELFVIVFRRIRDMYDSLGVNNIAYVWASKGWELTKEELEEWYPGDDYVDWCGYTHFGWGVGGGKSMIEFAREHNKPVLIGEATPQIFEGGDSTKTKDCFLDNPVHAKEAWDQWFIPFFKVIEENPDVIKAISYINVDWPSQDMWVDAEPFKHVDSRLHINEFIKQNWIEETSKGRYIKASPNLFNTLWGEM